MSAMLHHESHESRKSSVGPFRFDPQPSAIRFGRFSVVPSRRQLFRDGVAVMIGDRAFDLLVILVRQCGSVVDKMDLYREAWPSRIVDESNLRFQIGALRQVLGSDRDLLKTIRGRGYMLVLDEPEINDISGSDHGQSDPDPLDDGSAPRLSAMDKIALLERENGSLRQALAHLLASATEQGRTTGAGAFQALS